MYFGIWDYVSFITIDKFVAKLLSSVILSFSSFDKAEEKTDESTIPNMVFRT